MYVKWTVTWTITLKDLSNFLEYDVCCCFFYPLIQSDGTSRWTAFCKLMLYFGRSQNRMIQSCSTVGLRMNVNADAMSL